MVLIQCSNRRFRGILRSQAVRRTVPSDTGYDLICAGSTALGAGVFMRLVTVQNRRKDTNDRLIAVTFAILSVPLLILGVVL